MPRYQPETFTAEISMSRHVHMNHTRPAWVYWSLAFGFGPIIAAALAWPWLSRLSTLLVAQLIEQPESAVQVVPIRLAVHLALPTLALFLALRWSKLGRWLAISRLVLAPLLLANALLLGRVALLMTEFALGEITHLRLALEPATIATAAVALGLAATAIVLTTVWYRWLSLNPRWVSRCHSLLIER